MVFISGGAAMKKKILMKSFLASFVVGIVLSVFKPTEIAALACAVFIHEFCHFLALRLMGQRVVKIKIELCGIRMDYMGISSPLIDVFTAFAGPLGGMVYGLLLLLCLGGTEHDMVILSAEFSLLYSLFNLLPVVPLDGGRIFLTLCEAMENEDAVQAAKLVSKIFGLVFSLFGLYWMLKGEGSGMFAAGIWLLLMQS